MLRSTFDDDFHSASFPLSKDAFNKELTFDNDTTCDEDTQTRRYMIVVNEFRKTPAYGIYFNCFRFVCIGVIPFVLLVFLNAQIYSDLQKRKINKGKKASMGFNKNVDQMEDKEKKMSDTSKVQLKLNENNDAPIAEQEQIELASEIF